MVKHAKTNVTTFHNLGTIVTKEMKSS